MTKTLLLKGGKLISGNSLLPEKKNVHITRNGNSTLISFEKNTADETINAEGMYILPAAFDIGTCMYDSACAQRESELTAEAAAYFGGYSDIVAMPTVGEGGKYGVYNVNVVQAVKVSLPEQILNLGRGIYCAEDYISDSSRMREILFACRETDSVFISMPCDRSLSGAGSINRGKISRMLSDYGISGSSELTALTRDIILSEETGGKIHFRAISLADSVKLLRHAKRKNIPVTSGISPYHIAMTESDLMFYGSLAKLMPPLRCEEDRNELINGIKDGTVDCISSLHTPCTRAEKSGGISSSEFGATALDIAVSAAFTYIGGSTDERLTTIVRAMAIRPAEIFGQDRRIKEGSTGEVILFHPRREITVTKNTLKSKSSETPLMGLTLIGTVKRI